MQLEHVPLLQLQRDLYALPLGIERFQEYIKTMTNAATGDLELPLVAMNPMGKEHLPRILDNLLALDAEGAAAQAIVTAQAALTAVAGDFKVTLVVSDDLMGGWTNRYATELDYRMRQGALHKRGWLATLLWSSESYTAATIREEALIAIYRLAHIQQHGYANTLGELLDQEGFAMAQANATAPTLDADDLAYTHEVLTPYLHETLEPILIPALFGDAAARELGYRPLGLSTRAGLALALHNGKHNL